MHCPFCQSPDSRVVDTRIADDGASIRRRRECTACKHRFTTLETSSFQVVKRSGVVEPFSRNKVVQGVMKACQGRPVDEHDLARLAQQVEEKLRTSGVINVSSDEVGKAILPFLAELDEIAYLRFASVYLSFNDLDDFEAAITELRKTSRAPRSSVSKEIQDDNNQTNAHKPVDSVNQAGSGALADAQASSSTAPATRSARKTTKAGTKGTAKGRSKSATPKTAEGKSDAQASAAKTPRKRRAPRKKTDQDSMPSLLDS